MRSQNTRRTELELYDTDTFDLSKSIFELRCLVSDDSIEDIRLQEYTKDIEK